MIFMKVNIYYGGRGLLEDPSLYVMDKLTEVLEELRIEVTRYNLYEEKNGITMLPNTLKEADGIILVTTVEWFGIGGYMSQFLDACWLYGDKEKISTLYMLPVVMATTYGEKDGELSLCKAWEMLGGIPMNGLAAYVEEHIEFENNPIYGDIIEKKAEMLYRYIRQKIKNLPSSTNAVIQTVQRGTGIALTPQESEQLSIYVSDDTYVKKQKEDIEELAQLFKNRLGEAGAEKKEGEFISSFKKHFHPKEGFHAIFSIQISDTGKTLIIEINGTELKCSYGQHPKPDVVARTKHDILEAIINGRMTYQRAFMEGSLSAKGDFELSRNFDTIFQFN